MKTIIALVTSSIIGSIASPALSKTVCNKTTTFKTVNGNLVAHTKTVCTVLGKS